MEEPAGKDDFPSKIAEGLETLALRIRGVTVDKAETAAKWAALGLALFVLGLLALTLLLVGLLRILGEALGTEVAYAILGGLFLVAALLLWSQRRPKETDTDSAREP